MLIILTNKSIVWKRNTHYCIHPILRIQVSVLSHNHHNTKLVLTFDFKTHLYSIMIFLAQQQRKDLKVGFVEKSFVKNGMLADC